LTIIHVSLSLCP